MNAIKQEKYDTGVVRLYSILLVLHMTNNSIKQVLDIAPEAGGKISIFTGLVFAFFFIRECKNFNSALFLRLALLEMLFLILYAITVLRYPAAQPAIIGRGVWTIAFCIPLASLAYGMHDSSKFISRPMTIAMLIMFFEGVYVFFNNAIFDVKPDTEYNMAFGYMLLLPTLYFIYQSYSNKWFLPLFVILLILILLYASRGPLLFAALFLLLSFWGKQRGSKKFAMLLGAIFLGLLIYVSFDSLLSGVSEFTDTFGIHSRTLNQMLAGKEALTTLSGRDYIWIETEENIMKKPLLGWGVAGELSYMISYPHHFILEVLLHYGILIGSMIVVFVLGTVLRGLFLTHMRNPIILMFFCSGFCPLFLSGTYLMEPQLWILVALCLRPKLDYINYSYFPKRICQ